MKASEVNYLKFLGGTKQFVVPIYQRTYSWKNSKSGEREVKKSLRKTLLKYKLHKDNMLFSRAYDYIKQYY